MTNIQLYIRHRLQIPVCSLTENIDEKIKVVFNPPKTMTEMELSRITNDVEYQIAQVFEKYGHLLK